MTEEHHFRYRRFAGHATSVWCTCGWKTPAPTKAVLMKDVMAIWREHLSDHDAPKPA